MERKMQFNEVAAEYDRWRPTYVPQLYEDLFGYARVGRDSRALEVGIGTGLATGPVLKTGCRLTAVEIGDKLARYVKDKFRDSPNFEVVNAAFEDFRCPDESFDLIYSASAFHWIPEEIGYPKVLRLLKRGGAFARFGNHAGEDRENGPMHDAVQQVYAKYLPADPAAPKRDAEESAAAMAESLRRYGFQDVEYRLYRRVRPFDAEGYAALMGTYSDHLALGEARLNQLKAEMREAIDRHGGRINVCDTLDLYLARKP